MQLILKLLKEKYKLKRHLDLEIEGEVAMTFYANKFKSSGSIQGSKNNGNSQPQPPFTFEQRQECHMKILELNNQMRCFN
jgi:hypothetical protein